MRSAVDCILQVAVGLVRRVGAAGLRSGIIWRGGKTSRQDVGGVCFQRICVKRLNVRAYRNPEICTRRGSVVQVRQVAGRG